MGLQLCHQTVFSVVVLSLFTQYDSTTATLRFVVSDPTNDIYVVAQNLAMDCAAYPNVSTALDAAQQGDGLLVMADGML